ncbi:transmembrane protein, putative (macronuclear) [Tetrahymena thermophila SB210]|uniref:Transmembrane protein, putative n=1 Tax=Tetrahymena thermophila (strain SB210) TaxID=312017 RepID=Q24DG5_TETTS|nr:transmembrane protein, putative [Tetrahymena thermophila SB210]EAS05813.2 transmembrane protein, putative [Tetrahymena thermophila SB210]|eukprot:XP_001026058.2 transmembrane protein, putative [Tetrahymena thermophila SB210]
MTDFFKQTYVKHFIWTQAQALVSFIFITYLLISGTSVAWQIYHWIAVLFFYMFIQYVLIWHPETDMTRTLNACNCIILMICLPTFLYFYFAILLPAAETTDLEFIQVEKCVVSGITKTSLDGNEAYSLTYINFVQNGVSYLGSGCLTNQYQANSLNPIPPYKILKMNDTFECGPGIVDYPKGNPFNNTNVTDISHRFRVLRAGGSGGGHGGGGGGHSGSSHTSSRSSSTREKYIDTRPSNRIHSYDPVYGNRYHPYPYYSTNTYSTCKQQYTFSQVKLPTWLCSNENSNFKDLITPKTCWVHYYNVQTGYAQQNSKSRLNQRELKELSFVTFEYPIYYPKRSFSFIIVFVYYPLILALNSIFQYTANAIVLGLYNEDNQAETDQLNDLKQFESYSKNSVEMPLFNQEQAQIRPQM